METVAGLKPILHLAPAMEQMPTIDKILTVDAVPTLDPVPATDQLLAMDQVSAMDQVQSTNQIPDKLAHRPRAIKTQRLTAGRFGTVHHLEEAVDVAVAVAETGEVGAGRPSDFNALDNEDRCCQLTYTSR